MGLFKNEAIAKNSPFRTGPLKGLPDVATNDRPKAEEEDYSDGQKHNDVDDPHDVTDKSSKHVECFVP